MKEDISEEKKLELKLKRLQELIGDEYTIHHDSFDIQIYRVAEVQKKTLFGYKNVQKIQNVAGMHLNDCGSKEPDDCYAIIVCEQDIYPALKQFGEEYGYRLLRKAWPGAEQDYELPKPTRKPKEVVSESLDPRYKQISEDR